MLHITVSKYTGRHMFIYMVLIIQTKPPRRRINCYHYDYTLLFLSVRFSYTLHGISCVFSTSKNCNIAHTVYYYIPT